MCRLSRAGPSLSARTKRPDASEALGELAGGLAGGARLIVKKSDYEGWVAGQSAAGMAAGGRANEQVDRCGQCPHARAHLQTCLLYTSDAADE